MILEHCLSDTSDTVTLSTLHKRDKKVNIGR
jgi:hypothetical protein